VKKKEERKRRFAAVAYPAASVCFLFYFPSRFVRDHTRNRQREKYLPFFYFTGLFPADFKAHHTSPYYAFTFPPRHLGHVKESHLGVAWINTPWVASHPIVASYLHIVLVCRLSLPYLHRRHHDHNHQHHLTSSIAASTRNSTSQLLSHRTTLHHTHTTPNNTNTFAYDRSNGRLVLKLPSLPSFRLSIELRNLSQCLLHTTLIPLQSPFQLRSPVSSVVSSRRFKTVASRTALTHPSGLLR
jgi:hypothetical protein